MKTRYLLIIMALFTVIYSCKKEESINPDNYKVPQIEFALEEQPADLNKLDNLPAVGVVTSELGLKEVKMYIEKGSEKALYKEVTSFFNDKSYSFAEKFEYSADYKNLIVEATDLAGRATTGVLSFKVTDVIGAPTIVFNPAKISYDELDPTPIPHTTFKASSVAGLKTVEITRITKTQQIPWGYPVDFNDAPLEYDFDAFIDYKEDDIGLKVKVTDIYGQVKIETLPVEYKVVPPPVLTIGTDIIIMENEGNFAIPVQVVSVAGVSKIETYKVEKSGETLAKTTNYNGQNDLQTTETILFTNTMQAVRVEVTDKAGKKDSKIVKAVVGMKYLASYIVGSHRYTAGVAEDPGVFSLFSVNDMKGYNINDVLGKTENNVDIKFYMFGAGAVPRIYSIDGGTGTKSNEFVGKDGTVANFATANATRFLKLPGTFDFDNATVADIQSIVPSLITSNNINPAAAGDVIAFKTGPTSTAGANKVGIMKIIKIENTSALVKDQGTFTISVKFLKN